MTADTTLQSALRAIDDRLPPMQDKIVTALRMQPDGLSPDALNQLVGIRGNSLKVHIHRLRLRGYRIQSARSAGRPRKDTHGNSLERYQLLEAER
jgi:biotin operon repressor